MCYHYFNYYDYYNFIVQVGGKEQPPKSSDAFVDVEEQTSADQKRSSQLQDEKMSEVGRGRGIPTGGTEVDRNVARQPEVLPL